MERQASGRAQSGHRIAYRQKLHRYRMAVVEFNQLAKEIRDEYVDTVSKMYYSYFKTYAGRLLKLQVCSRHRGVSRRLWRKYATL